MLPAHEARVEAVARQVTARPARSKLTISKNTPTHSVRDQAYKVGLHAVDVSALNHILQIDAGRRLARVEGQATMGQLAAATLAQGLLPAVVPEFRQFTVAGLINGEGIQSSAHRHGVFTHNVRAMNVMLADGSCLEVSADQHVDVFKSLPESLGTLGLIIAATIALVPAKRYVKCTYRRYGSLAEYVAAFSAALGTTDFHEGIIFGPRCYVLAIGEFVDAADGLPVFDPDRPGGEYWYQHVLRCAAARAITTELIATPAYLSRLERGLWWMMECHADFPLLSETEWGRRRMDAAAADAYRKTGFATRGLTAIERDRCQINQDLGVTIERLQEAVARVQSQLQVYPLWNCAVRLPEDERRRVGTSHLVDVGIYGEPMARGYRSVRDMRALQQRVPAPSLWGVSYLTWDEIVALNPQKYERYERMRQTLDAGAAFLHIREKVVWVGTRADDDGKIPLWRFYRSFGRRWYLNPVAHLVLVVAAVSKAIWRKPSIAR